MATHAYRTFLRRRRTILAEQLDQHHSVARRHWMQVKAYRDDAEAHCDDAEIAQMAANLACHTQWAAERLESICEHLIMAIVVIDEELDEDHEELAAGDD